MSGSLNRSTIKNWLVLLFVYDWEQQIKQKLVFDLEMAWDCQKAAETDDVQYCLNYAEVSQFILDYVQAKPFLLIERVAYEVAEQLQQRFGIVATLSKMHTLTALK